MQVDPDNATARFEHGGNDFYFCSIGCARRFAEQPEKFAVTKPEARGAGVVETVEPSKTTLPILPGLLEAAPAPPVVPQQPIEKDPVCGMSVDPEQAAGVVEYRNRKYYFCSIRCAERFKNVPENFVGTLGATRLAPPHAPTMGAAKLSSDARPDANSAGLPAGKKARYTCPMDPEIVKDGPGACPICGMALEPMDVFAEVEADPEYDSMLRRLWVSAALSVALLMLSMFGETLGLHLAPGVRNLIELVLATPVVLWGGWPFFERFWSSLVNRSPNMFTLIGLGTSAAYLDSLAATLFPKIFPASSFDAHGGAPVYFEAAAVITTLVLLGQVLELRARKKTSGAIRGLLQLTPAQAHHITAAGVELDVNLGQVERGYHLRVRPGERVPVDGVILEGASALDEAMVSGESLPVEKSAGDLVTGGTLNTSGSFIMETQRIGTETTLAQIVKLVSEAQRSRAPMQRLADQVAGYFVPGVVGASALAFLGWMFFGPEPHFPHAMVAAVSVLIIACPCALGLATPMSIMVAVGRGAQAGVLVRNAAALEGLARVDTLVVDKTGTITEGKPHVIGVGLFPGSGSTKSGLLWLAASVESASEHPLARAIVNAEKEKGVELARVSDFRATPGGGAEGRVLGDMIRVGTLKYLRERGVQGAEGERLAHLDFGSERRAEGTLVFVAVNEKVAGAIALADQIKASASEALQALRKDGMRVVMLTGDLLLTAKAIAAELGIRDVEAEVLPGQKSAVIKKLREAGQVVAMVGDGINDAPALAAAQVGIAMGTGTDVAMESAGIVLLHGDLRGLVRARNLSKATVHNIKENLLFAFLYNAIGIPLAAGVLYPVFGWLLSPMIASAAMSLSSVSVIANALRLRNRSI
jgi:Cu+-exporting ATPase